MKIHKTQQIIQYQGNSLTNILEYYLSYITECELNVYSWLIHSNVINYVFRFSTSRQCSLISENIKNLKAIHSKQMDFNKQSINRLKLRISRLAAQRKSDIDGIGNDLKILKKVSVSNENPQVNFSDILLCSIYQAWSRAVEI